MISGFVLRLDDGSKVWIQCRFERIHKLCARCGLIGHNRGQCTHCMDDIELMLYRQHLRIQDLHQVQFRFDALQPQFSNYLRASHNRQRRWTTQARFGFTYHPSVHANHQTHPPIYLDPSTPSTEHYQYASTPSTNPIPHINSSSIHLAINMLNLNPVTPPLPNPFPFDPVSVTSPVPPALHPSEITSNSTATQGNPFNLSIPPTPVNSLASTISIPSHHHSDETFHPIGSNTPPSQPPPSSNTKITLLLPCVLLGDPLLILI